MLCRKRNRQILPYKQGKVFFGPTIKNSEIREKSDAYFGEQPMFSMMGEIFMWGQKRVYTN